MSTVIVTLKTGLKLTDEKGNETVHIVAELREPTAGDLIDATEESERLTLTPDGYQLVASPTMVGVNALRRQIVRIGDHPGPLTMSELKKLTAHDLNLLQEEAKKLEAGVITEANKRGRNNQAPG